MSRAEKKEKGQQQKGEGGEKYFFTAIERGPLTAASSSRRKVVRIPGLHGGRGGRHGGSGKRTPYPVVLIQVLYPKNVSAEAAAGE